MRKIPALILALILVLPLASCGKKKPADTATVSEEPVASAGSVESSSTVVSSSEQVSSAAPEKKNETKKIAREPLAYNENIVNIALFGLDTRNPKSFSGRSDSIMILSLDKSRHTVKIVSVVRDSLVPIPGHGYGKINAAYAYGGHSLALKTLNNAFLMNITDYAATNFFGMAEIIDAVGGVDVELTAKEVQNAHCINGTIDEVCNIMGKKADEYHVAQSGKQHLNGIQAVGYCRIRKAPNIWGGNGDYGRTERQRFVLDQLCQKVCSMSSEEYPALIAALLKHVETSLSAGEIGALAGEILTHSPTVQKANIPNLSGKDMRMSAPTSRYGSVEYYDIDFAAKLIYAFLNNDVSFRDYIAKNGIEKNNWFAKGIY